MCADHVCPALAPSRHLLQSDDVTLKFFQKVVQAHSKPLFDGLMAAFGPAAVQGTSGARLPNIVVCDFISLGCADFAYMVNATLVFSQPDILQMAPYHMGSSLSPIIRSSEVLRTRGEAAARWRDHLSLTLSGLLSRIDTFIQPLVMQALLPLGNNTDMLLYEGRPWHLPLPGSSMFDGNVLYLQGTFVPLEPPSNLPVNVILVGPVLPSSVRARADRYANPIPVPPRLEGDEPALAKWLASSPTPAAYISQGTLFPVEDARTIVALCQGLVSAGLRVVFKTVLVQEAAIALAASGLLGPSTSTGGSPQLVSDKVFLSRRCVLGLAFVFVF
jgi:hypothetical protein